MSVLLQIGMLSYNIQFILDKADILGLYCYILEKQVKAFKLC